MTYALGLFLSKHARTLSAVFYSCIGICLICAAYWGVKSLFMLPQIKGAEAVAKTKQAALLIAMRDVQDQKLVGGDPAPSPNAQTVQLTEAEVENYAHEENCKVAQFSATSAPTPYVSHFGGGGDGYVMYIIKLTLNGNLSNVLYTLQKLSDGPIPFEFGTITLAPILNGDKNTVNQVSANIEIDPVAKQGASK